MRIDVHDTSQRFLFREQVQPPAEQVRDVNLQWEGALDDQQRLCRCPVCGCRELFVRKDFPQRLGLGIVIVAAVIAFVLLTLHQAFLAFGVLALPVVIDLLIYGLVGRCAVCYRCRSEFRDTPIAEDVGPWDLGTGEKYRQLLNQSADNADGGIR